MKNQNHNVKTLLEHAYVKAGSLCLVVAPSIRTGQEGVWRDLEECLAEFSKEAGFDYTVTRVLPQTYDHVIYIHSKETQWSKILMVSCPTPLKMLERINGLGWHPSLIMVPADGGYKEIAASFVSPEPGVAIEILVDPPTKEVLFLAEIDALNRQLTEDFRQQIETLSHNGNLIDYLNRILVGRWNDLLDSNPEAAQQMADKDDYFRSIVTDMRERRKSLQAAALVSAPSAT